jgi:hypothetical protein
MAAGRSMVERSPITVSEEANLSQEAAERWRSAVIAASASKHQRGSAAQLISEPGNGQLALHPLWSGFFGGLLAGGAGAGVAFATLMHQGYFARKGTQRRTDRVSILVISFAVPFLLVVRFSKAYHTSSMQPDTLHTR